MGRTEGRIEEDGVLFKGGDGVAMWDEGGVKIFSLNVLRIWPWGKASHCLCRKGDKFSYGCACELGATAVEGSIIRASLKDRVEVGVYRMVCVEVWNSYLPHCSLLSWWPVICLGWSFGLSLGPNRRGG